MSVNLYVLEREHLIDTGLHPASDRVFMDFSGIHRARLTCDGRLSVYAGYAWDGCSPKWSCCGWVFGAWDGNLLPNGKPQTWEASLAHDVLYQFLSRGLYTRREADDVFYRLLKKANFPYATAYYWGVRVFGWL